MPAKAISATSSLANKMQLDAGQSDIRDILASEQNGVRRFGESLSQLEDWVEKVELLPEQLANL